MGQPYNLGGINTLLSFSMCYFGFYWDYGVLSVGNAATDRTGELMGIEVDDVLHNWLRLVLTVKEEGIIGAPLDRPAIEP